MIKWVQKRDGRIVPFQAEKIADAIFAAAKAVGGEDRRQAEVLAGQVIHLLQQKVLAQEVPQVEEIQDLVEKVLIEQGHARTAKAYILYRNHRTRIREAKSELMDAVSEIFQEAGSDTQVCSTPLGKLQRIAIAASERYCLHNLLPRDFSLAHQRCRIHIDRLAHYTTAVTAAVIDLRQLLDQGQQVGRIRVPQLLQPHDLAQAIQALIAAAQSETLEEILFANLDQAFATMCRRQRLVMDSRQLRSFAQRLLSHVGLTLMTGSAQPLKVCFSVGLESSELGQQLIRALLGVLAQGRSGAAIQFIYQLEDGVNWAPGDKGYPNTCLARQVAQQCGNPSFVYFSTLGPDDVQFLASGTRLEMTSPILISRTYVNLPRLALEAENGRDFLAGIDAIFSLVAKQVVHRSEILTALQPSDLPLTALQGSATRQLPPLAMALLLLVPIGIAEALQVARHRFADTLAINENDFISLLNEICEHWRNYYSLNLQIGLVPAVRVAQRFFAHDVNSFPLLRNLWPQKSSYSYLYDNALCGVFPSGQVAPWPESNQLQEGIVYVVPIRRTICLACGQILGQEEIRCSVCGGEQLGELTQDGGYITVSEQLVTN